ncbi:MAG: type III glutamate--ammonia ligase [Alphaproteobacteria bacterium]|nr:type III glutamate--ammonia ligase [Alphaproteobacteria bacterium]
MKGVTIDLAKLARDKGIKYFLISYVDLFGALRAKLVPATAIGGMQKNGAGFAGFASNLDLNPAHPDVFALPDPSSLIQLPWKPEVGWLASDLYMDGKPLEQSPRYLLKKMQAKAAEMGGFVLKTGVEAEFFLLAKDGTAISDPEDLAAKPCYDQQALMRRYDVITEICDAMQTLGWGPYQNDHEDANGQFEMNWDYDDVLLTADRHVFFKYMAKALAEKHGYRASFMPKPFNHLTGNGCHIHLSLWAGKKNAFSDSKGELGMSALAYEFLGGVLHSADAFCAFTNPTINSFKRINAPVTLSGSTWSPSSVTHTGNNRTHMVRIPDAGRFEVRLPDGAMNPYLGPAAILAAGLDGMAKQRDPGKRLDIDMYTQGESLKNVKKLPLNLLDALRNLDKSKVLREAFGSDFIDSYVKLKMAEWNGFMQHATDWERQHTLDC